jgi:hypothetical protein
VVEEVDLPGWVWLPEDMEPAQRDSWVEEVVPAVIELIGNPEPDGGSTTSVDVRAVLESGLEARAESPSYMMYLVFPVHAPAAVMCHVNLVQTQDLPDWDDFSGRMHPAQARYLGPGVQITTEVTAETDQGPAELTTLVYIFADAEAGIVVTFEPAFPQLIAQAMVGAGLLINALAVSRPDGTAFEAAPSTAPVIAGDEWPSGSQGVS